MKIIENNDDYEIEIGNKAIRLPKYIFTTDEYAACEEDFRLFNRYFDLEYAKGVFDIAQFELGLAKDIYCASITIGKKPLNGNELDLSFNLENDPTNPLSSWDTHDQLCMNFKALTKIKDISNALDVVHDITQGKDINLKNVKYFVENIDKIMMDEFGTIERGIPSNLGHRLLVKKILKSIEMSNFMVKVESLLSDGFKAIEMQMYIDDNQSRLLISLLRPEGVRFSLDISDYVEKRILNSFGISEWASVKTIDEDSYDEMAQKIVGLDFEAHHRSRKMMEHAMRMF